VSVLLGQSPQAFKYQALARDQDGHILPNWNISLRISIVEQQHDGQAVYVETQQVMSNIYGMITLSIGEGTVTKGNFESISWGENKYFIKMEMDVNGGTNYQEMGTTQLYAVPYALYAEQAGNLLNKEPAELAPVKKTSPTQTKRTRPARTSSTPNSKFPADTNSYINVNVGNVGIGTTDPTEKLDVEGNARIDTVYTGALSGNSPLHIQTDGKTRLYIEEGRSGLGVNTTDVDSSALVELESTTKGFLPPRMITTERDNIVNPAQGLMIYNQDCQCINFFNGVKWVEYGADPNMNFECGDGLFDERDETRYKTIKIGNQCWMAENLNIGKKINGDQDQTDNDAFEKYCYEDIPANCSKYGGLYQWGEMMQYDTNRFNTGICPEDWRLPTPAEWDSLVNATGGESVSGDALKENGISGFEALLAGSRKDDGTFVDMQVKGMFWTAGQVNTGSAEFSYLSDGNTGFYQNDTLKTNGLAVRCIKGLPNRVDTAVLVIDTLVYELISDSADMTNGIFRYNIIQRDEMENIVQDNVIIGETDGGYLRLVTDTIYSGNQMTLLTEQATFEDIWESVESTDSLTIAGDTVRSANHWSQTSIDYLAKGVSIVNDKGGFKYDFDTVPLFDNGNIVLSIPDGHVKLDPNFKFSFKIKKRKLKKLGVRANNALFELDFDIALAANAEQEFTYKKKLASTTKRIRFFVGWIPVWIKIKTDLMIYDTIRLSGSFNATTGYTNTTRLDVGIEYNNGDWIKVWDPSNEDSFDSFDASGQIDLTQKFSIVPEISFLVYGKAGPWFNLEFYEKFDENIILPDLFWKTELGLGLNANVGAKIKAFGKIASYGLFIEGPYKALWEVPGKLTSVSGNNQDGPPGVQLADPIKVKVTDNLNNAIQFVPVSFEPDEGRGSVASTTVMTDANGFAETTWTLDTLPGRNKVIVSVYPHSLEQIDGSPIEFTAMGQIGCPGISTVEYGGQTYYTVQVGDQCWLRENLNIGVMTDYYSIGDNEIIEKCCYGNNEDNCDIYGGLYLWDEMMQYSTTPGARGICPEGFYIPDSLDWATLRSFLGGGDVAGGKMKEFGTDHWKTPNAGATNSSGFMGLPGGYFTLNTEDFEGVNESGYAWSSSESINDPYYIAGGYFLNYLNDNENGNLLDKYEAASVRCLKDTVSSYFSCGDELIDTRDSMTYSTVEIGSQCWMAENLNIGERIDVDVDQTDDENFEKYCWNDLESECNIRGGLYQLDEAMDYDTIEGAQGICPVGWHLPTDEEWKQLEGEADSQYDYPDSEWDDIWMRGHDAGIHLRTTTGWPAGNGDDSYGFAALAGGTDCANFWTSSIIDNYVCFSRNLAGSFGGEISRDHEQRPYGLSIRCLKDD